MGDAEERGRFVRDVLPRSERTSVVYTGYELFTPSYRELRNIETFDLAEDVRFGPELTTTAGVGLEGLGSDATFGRLTGDAGWTVGLGDDGMAVASGDLTLRRQGGRFIDNSAGGLLRLVTPSLRVGDDGEIALGRVVAEARLSTRWNETQNRFLTLGGDNGLRGFVLNQFDGQRRAVGQLEVRTAPISVLFTRVGLVAFYEAGGAADSLRTMAIYHDAGIGLRLLIPQLSPELLRYDFAVALNGRNAGGLRFSAGFRQSF
jgi:outer membrane translocation and assembly module TamA